MWPLVSSFTTPSPSQTTRSIAEMVTQMALDVGCATVTGCGSG